MGKFEDDIVNTQFPDTIGKWFTAYLASDAWQKRARDVAAPQLKEALSWLAFYGDSEFGQAPTDWTAEALETLLTDTLVARANFTAMDYWHIVPALYDFFTFVGEQKWLPAKRVKLYQQTIIAAAPTMVTRADDSDNFAADKFLTAHLIAADVDPDNEGAVAMFVVKSELAILNKIFPDDAPADDAVTPKAEGVKQTAAILDDPAMAPELLMLFDPDRDEAFLRANHRQTLGAQTWQRQTARLVHHRAVITGVRLWLTRDAYPVASWASSQEVYEAVILVMDSLYQQRLETPEMWTAASWQLWGSFCRQTELIDGQAALVTDVSLLDMLADQGVVTPEQAATFAAAFREG